jgi:hypothetical protein
MPCRYLVWLIIVSKKKSSPILRIEELYNFMASAVKRKKTLGDYPSFTAQVLHQAPDATAPLAKSWQAPQSPLNFAGL